MIPTARGGYRPFRTAVDNGMPAVTSGVIPAGNFVTGAALAPLLNGTSRVFASRYTNVYELTNPLTTPSWTAQATVATFSGNAGIFTQYANSTIFTSMINATLISTTSGPFSTLTGASKALTCAVASNIAVLFNYDDGSAVLDGFHASDVEDITTAGWTTGTTGSYCMKGRIITTPGPITAACGLGDRILVFKKKGFYVMEFTGELPGPYTTPWNVDCRSTSIGCIGPRAICPFLDFVTWVGVDDIYVFDGQNVRSITEGMRRTAFATISANNLTWQILHDETESCLYYFYSEAENYNWLCYNYVSGKWSNGVGLSGTATVGVAAVLNTNIATNGTIISNNRKTAFVIDTTDSKIKLFDGQISTVNVNSQAAAATVIGWVYGDGNMEYEATRIRCNFGARSFSSPTAPQLPDLSTAGFYASESVASGAAPTITPTIDGGDGTFNASASARWIIPAFSFNVTTPGGGSGTYLYELVDFQVLCEDKEMPCIGGRR